jgi:predicted phage terminase large subunit-like protein
LWSAREGRAELNAAQHRLGAYGYACQYLQNPIARGGNLFKQEWFGTFREAPRCDLVVQSWDCTFKSGQTNDYSACVTIGVVRKRRADSNAAPGHYLLHAWRGKVEFVELKRRAIALHEQWLPSVVLVEDAASGQSLVQELLANTNLPIKGVKPDGDKYTRAASVTPAIEGGGFFLPEGASWSSAYLAEMTTFPGAAHDDFVDATVQALTYLRASPEPNILKFYRNQAERQRTGRLEAHGYGSTIAASELERYRQEAGFCRSCGTNLLKKSAILKDARGQLCKERRDLGLE